MANVLNKALFPHPDFSLSLSLGGENGMRGGCQRCLPFCTDTCNPKLHQTPCPCPETAHHSENLSSCLELPSNSESWKESKKAKEPDRKGQREGGLPEEGNNQEQRALRAGSKHRAASQVLRTSPPQPPAVSHPLFRDWQSTTANISLSNHLPPLKCRAVPLQCGRNLSDPLGEEKRQNVEMQCYPSCVFHYSLYQFRLFHSKSVHGYKDVSFWCLAAICVTLNDFVETQSYLK